MTVTLEEVQERIGSTCVGGPYILILDKKYRIVN